MASKHVLAELAAMHSRAVDTWEEQVAVPAADIPSFSSKASSGWHAYVAEQRAHGIDMAEIGSKRHKHAAGQKDDNNDKAMKKAYADRSVENLRPAMPGDRTPLSMADETMPVREDVVE